MAGGAAGSGRRPRGGSAELPERYGVTIPFMVLRASERMAWLTPERFSAMSAVDQAMVLEFERIREEEEARFAASLSGGK